MAHPAPTAPAPKEVYDSDTVTLLGRLAELIRYRELFVAFAKRDLKVRYTQTLLGPIWVVMQPLVALVIFTFIFGRGLKVDTGGVPYPVFAMCGLSAWTFFAVIFGQSANAVIAAGNMLKRVYFPRLILPLGKGFLALIDFSINLGLLAVLMAAYGVLPDAQSLWLPAFILANVMVGLTVGIWVSVLTIRYRDLIHVVPFLIQVGMYATPVAYPSSLVPEAYRSAYLLLNPMASIVEGFRWSLLGQGEPDFVLMTASMGAVFLLLLLGLRTFLKTESRMADLV